MNITKMYNSDEEKQKLLEKYKDKNLVEIRYLQTGNYLVFSDEKIIDTPTETEKLVSEITKLKEEQKQQDKILLENSLKLAMLDIK